MSNTTMHRAPEVHEYKAEMKQLLHLIIHSLYTHPEIFLRELISNASDALNKVRFRELTGQAVLDSGTPLEIRITLDRNAHTITVEDTGIGMTKDDLINRLGTVASSGTLEFVKSLKEQGKTLDVSMIGQFGVGFYSVFMVADEVVVETRHAEPDSIGLRWKSDGKGSFTIEDIDKPTRGTRISFRLKDSATEFSEEYRVRSIIQKYSNFVDFPILIASQGSTLQKVNTIRALWQAPKDTINPDEAHEFYKFLTHDYQSPLGYLHLAIEGSVNFKALLFIPATPPVRPFILDNDKSLHLYTNKVLIEEHCKHLLPEYLRFVRGVVDTDDLPLNVSREVTQSSPQMAKINKVLTSKILGLLHDWSAHDPDKYQRFYTAFGQQLKLGINTDTANRDQIVQLLRFETTHTAHGSLRSLKEYVERMNPEQQEIYFLTGEHRDTMLNNPNLEYFQKHSIEVLLLTDPVDIIIIPTIGEFEGKKLVSIDKADIRTVAASSQEQKEPSMLDSALLALFKEALGDKVEDVVPSKRLVDSPVTLVVGKEGMDAQTERMMKMLDKTFKGGRKILEVNMEHPLIRNLSRLQLAQAGSPLLRQYILHLYEGALLLEGNLPSPAIFIRRMIEIMTDATR
ncbi:MAG: molecular chaperone HtpG [Bacteroidota bacterium]|nr:molecular chaperone HtpG [Candidatus Kapabacteria bacterium]MDW8219189.1 molecular chaperone HtpG [Bacteroidota bacterium]